MQDAGNQRNDTFARRLRLTLKASGTTQAKLARLADIDQSSISRYLRGQCEPNLRQFCAIARALKVKPRHLLGEEPPPVMAVRADDDVHFHIFVRGRLMGQWRGRKFACDCVRLAPEREAKALLEAHGMKTPRTRRG